MCWKWQCFNFLNGLVRLRHTCTHACTEAETRSGSGVVLQESSTLLSQTTSLLRLRAWSSSLLKKILNDYKNKQHLHTSCKCKDSHEITILIIFADFISIVYRSMPQCYTVYAEFHLVQWLWIHPQRDSTPTVQETKAIRPLV